MEYLRLAVAVLGLICGTVGAAYFMIDAFVTVWPFVGSTWVAIPMALFSIFVGAYALREVGIAIKKLPR